MKHTNIYAKYSCLLLVFLMLAFLLPLRAFSDDATHETVRVGFFAFDGYHMIDDNGIRSGYGYDFLQLAARYLDINYDYIGYDKSWEDMQQMLLNGEIDLLTSAQKTPDRENDFAYSRPIGTSCGIMTVSSSNTSIIAKDYTTYEGIRVGLLKNNSRNDDFAKLAAEKGFTYVPIYFDMADEMDDALLDGKIDAAVSSSLRRTAQERIVEEFATSNFYAIVRKDDTDLLNKINYAIDQMNAVEGDWENTLNNKYYTHLESKNLAFTNQELALLHEYSDGGKTLKITCSTDRAPYSYLEDGKVKGILPDYFEQIANYAGFNYEYLIPSSREELYEWQLNNTADVYIDARLPYEQWVEEHGGMITAPYVTMKLAMVTRRDFSGDIKKISVAEEQGTYGIEENLATDAERIAVPTREEALQAVLNGKVDATFVYLYSAQEFVNRDERGLLTYTALESPSYQYRMVVSKNVSHTWAGILTKCIYAMPDDAIEGLATQYTNYKASNISIYTLIRLYPAMFVIAVLILLLAAVLIVRLKAEQKLMAYEQKRSNEMAELAIQAQTANESKSRFLFNRSHDIRTPMNAIIGFTDLALKVENNPPKTRDYLDKIRTSGEHLLDIINDVLEMSRIENSKIELKEAPCDLNELIEEVVTIISGASQGKKQTLLLDTKKIKDSHVLCDQLRLKEVLVNLLSNAVKFTQEKGKIYFSISETSTGVSDTGLYTICVQDNGIGMNPEFLNKVFEPFEREQTSTVSGIPGTGLGLPIAKQFVELMGGSIHVESTYGKGSTFTVELPLKHTSATEISSPAEKSSANVNFADKHLLLVEDNELNLEIEVTILESAGFRVTTAENGAEAVEKVRSALNDPYDAVLMDIQMPVMDGYEASRQIRHLEDKRLSQIPIIAVSANAFEEDVNASLAAGMNGHIAKPISVDKLFALLKKTLA